MKAKYSLHFTPEAVIELRDAISYYNNKQRGLGKRFYQDMSEQLELITDNPFTRSVRYDNVRFALGDIFPYAIHYTVDEMNKMIIVQAILSHWQKPRS